MSSGAIAFALLKLIADGRVHSGKFLARQLGCSHLVLRQAIRDITAEFALPVLSVRGRGYRLGRVLEMLDVALIRKALKAPAADCLTIITVDVVDSTNTRLMECTGLREGHGHGLTLVAELQTAGKGRLGRCWTAALGRGLTFSLLWHFDRVASELAGLSLAVGVALARVLRGLGVPTQLKWPNDLLLLERKLAGVLIEVSGERGQTARVVIGIGLNLELPSADNISGAALRETGLVVSRNELLALLLNELVKVLVVFNQEGFSPFCEEWFKLCSHKGKKVKLSFPHGASIVGLARGIRQDGALLLETVRGLHAYTIGEVSLRKCSETID